MSKGRNKVAFVCGSFSPPHKGHAEMLKFYSNMADYVFAVISNPSKEESIRKTENGSSISPETSKKILKIYDKELGFGNFQALISENPSPVQETMKYVSQLKDCDVILGLGKKDNGRFDDIYRTYNVMNGVKILDPNTTMFCGGDESISGTFVR